MIAVAISPDGCQLASGSSDTLRIWDLCAPEREPHVLLQEAFVADVEFSPDGAWLAASAGGTVYVWDLRHLYEDLRELEHAHEIFSVAFSSDCRLLASGSEDETARIWNLHQWDGQSLCLIGHTNSVTAICCSPDGRWIASGSWDETILVWDCRQPNCQPIVLSGNEGPVWDAVFSENGSRLYSGEWPREPFREWELATGQPIAYHNYTLWDVKTATPLEPKDGLSRDGGAFALITDNGMTIGFPVGLHHICYVPTRERFVAGAQGNHVYILKLEGPEANG